MTRVKHGQDEISVGAPAAVETVELAASGGYGRIFAKPGFRNLWIGQTISGIGDWLIVGLLIGLVGKLAPGSSMAVAGIMIAKIAPSLLLGSVLGVLVDRFDRRHIMIACDVTNGVLAIGLIFTGQLWLIYLIVFLMEICNLLFVPAKNALIPALVDQRDLASANGLSYTTQQASMLIGLLLSGAIVAVFVSLVRGFVAAGVPWVSAALASAPVYGYLVGERAGVALDAISFGVSALLIFSIHVRARPRPTTETFRLSMLGSDIRESFQTLRSRTELRAILVSIGFAILGGGAIISVGLVYIQSLSGPIPLLSQLQHVIPSLRTFDALNAQASTTFMLAFLALGMFLGAIIVPKLAARLPLEALFVSAVALFGVSLLGFALSSVYSIASIFAVAAGFFVAQVTVAGNTFVSETVEDALRGRVFTALESVLRVSLLASMLLIAPLGDLVNRLAGQYLSATGLHLSLTGPRVTLVCAAVIVLAASVYAYAAVDWRGKRGTEAAADA